MVFHDRSLIGPPLLDDLRAVDDRIPTSCALCANGWLADVCPLGLHVDSPCGPLRGYQHMPRSEFVDSRANARSHFPHLGSQNRNRRAVVDNPDRSHGWMISSARISIGVRTTASPISRMVHLGGGWLAGV